MNKMRNSVLVKVIGLVCTLALVLGAIYVPVTLSAFAATIPVTPDQTITFGFEPSEDPISGSWADGRAEDGFGCASWGMTIMTVDNQQAIGRNWGNAWTQGGGYRLNNKDGVYRLETNSRYVVRIKASFRKAPSLDTARTAEPYLSLGYGFTGPDSDNQVVTMSATIAKIAESSGLTYTISDISGTRVIEPSDEWYDLTYVFTTPADFAGKNTSFGFYQFNVQNTEIYVDDVKVTKLGSNTGMVMAKDEYNGETTVLLGNIGENAQLPVLVGKQPEHEFKGWFTDEARTVPAENVKFTAEVQNVYSKWRAPVSITFVDAYKNTNNKIDGFSGDVIPYPAEPVDFTKPAQKYFAGWYTTEMFTQKYDEEKFGSSDITLYAKWIDRQTEYVQDFENYEYSERGETTTDSKGNVCYANRGIFGESMTKIDDPTESGRGKVVKFNWDSSMVKVPEDPNTFEAKNYDNEVYYGITMGTQTFNYGTQYVMYFDYYVENIETQHITMKCQNIRATSGWPRSEDLTTKTYNVTSADKDGKWHTGAIVFTMKQYAGIDPNVHAIFRPSGNKNATVYLDNFRFVPAQANEVIMTVNEQNGNPAKHVPVVKGDPIDIEVPTYGERTFKGWYLDGACTIPFEETVVPAKNFEVFARWSPTPENFQNYPHSTTNASIFGQTISIVKGEGVGYKDNAVAKFVLDGDAVYSQDGDKVTYWAARSQSWGHVIKLDDVSEGTVYRISFMYKGDASANVNSVIRFQTAQPNNCWGHGKDYEGFSLTVTPDMNEWQKAEFLMRCSLADSIGSGLFLRFQTSAPVTDFEQYAVAYVDDILIEPIDKPFILYDGQNNKQPTVVQGKVGEKIVHPATPKKVGMKFVGWYLDTEFKQPFTDTVYAKDMNITVYAKYDFADNFTVNFENVGKNRGKEDDSLFFRGGLGSVAKTGYNKSKGLVFDRGLTDAWSSGNALFEDSNQVLLSNTNNYYITFKYCVQRQLTDNSFLSFTSGHAGNAWAFKHSLDTTTENAGEISSEWSIPTTCEVGRWYTGALILDTSKIFVHDKKGENGEVIKGDPKEYAAVYLWLRGGGKGMVVVDDITFKKLPAGHQAYIVDNGGAKSVPGYVSGRIGTSFRGQLPRNPQFENHIFKNYFRYDVNHNQAIIEDKDMVFTKDQISVVANWVRLHTVQDFENYAILLSAYPGLGPADHDYELYDGKKDGNSLDNVTSGRYSIHRLGTSAYCENIQILSDDLRICGDEKFTVKMKVKIGKHFHTDGAVKIVGCKSPTYAWATSGSFHPIAVIADIADGEWHEVSYTFSSVERYLAIQTPGYVEVFIDDVVIDRADPEMPVSTPPEYTEYVQALRDKDGNLIEVDTTSIDVGSIIDFSLYIGGVNVVTILIIVGGVLLVAATVFAVLFIIKKRKAKKA